MYLCVRLIGQQQKIPQPAKNTTPPAKNQGGRGKNFKHEKILLTIKK